LRQGPANSYRRREAAFRKPTLIAAILERPVIEKIFTDLGLEPQPPPRAPARESKGRQAG